MAVLRQTESTNSRIVLQRAGGQKIGNIIGFAISLIVAFTLLNSFEGGGGNPVTAVILLIVGLFGFSSLYGALSGTRVVIDSTVRAATRVTSLLGVPIIRQALDFSEAQRIRLNTTASGTRRQPSSPDSWQVTVEPRAGRSLLVNSQGSYDQMSELAQAIGSMMRLRVEGPSQKETADKSQQVSAGYTDKQEAAPPVEASGDAPPIGTPAVFGDMFSMLQASPPASKSLPAPNSLITDISSPAAYEGDTAIQGAPVSSPTTNADTSSGVSKSSSVELSPPLAMPVMPPLGDYTRIPATSAVSDIPEVKGVTSKVTPATPRSPDELKRVVAADPSNGPAQYELANYLFQRGDFDGARAAFESVLRVDPANADAQNDLGALYLESRDLKSAESAFRRAVGLDPFSSAGYYNLGLVLMRTGRKAEAQEAFKRAAQNASNSSDPVFSNALQGRYTGPQMSGQG